MKKTNLRKTILIAAAALLVFGVTACGKKEEAETAAESTAAESTDTANAGTETSEAASEIESLTPVKPENMGTVELGEYKGITIKTAKVSEVSDEDVDSYISTNLLPNATGTPADTVVDGAVTLISFKGVVDGVENPNCCSEGSSLTIGSGRYIEGFEDGLIGHKKGETVTLNLTFPEEYTEELKGKDVVFTVTINDITIPLTELTDDAANELSGGQYTSAKEFKANLKQIMQDSYDLQAKQQLLYDASTAALENAKVDPTKEAVEWQIDSFIVSYNTTLKSNYGMNLDALLQQTGQTYEEFRNSVYDYCVEGVSRTMVLEEIAKKENIVVDDSAMVDYLAGYGASLEEVLEVTTEDELKRTIMEDKASQIIVDNGIIEYTETEQ